MRAKPTHHKTQEQRRDPAYQQADSEHNNSPWIKRLTTTAVDPLTLRFHLIHAGESFRNQTLDKLQRQNGNHYIQREGLFPAIGDDDRYNLAEPNVSKTAPNPVSPVPVPYPNSSSTSSATQAVEPVNFENQGISTGNSQISTSHGDEPVTPKGIMSNAVTGPQSYNIPSPSVVFQNSPHVAISSPGAVTSRP